METKRYIGEVWKPIKGYVGLYEVSNYGRVKSLNFNHTKGKEMIMKTYHESNAYLQIKLYVDGKPKTFLIHRLVAEAFLPNPNNLLEVNHKDCCKTNNYIHINEDGSVDPEKSNLEWCDRKYNVNYGDRTKTVAKKLTNGILSKPVLQFSLSGDYINEYPSAMEAHRQTDIHHANICECCNGKRKTAGTNGIRYIWKYKDAS